MQRARIVLRWTTIPWILEHVMEGRRGTCERSRGVNSVFWLIIGGCVSVFGWCFFPVLKILFTQYVTGVYFVSVLANYCCFGVRLLRALQRV